MRSDDAGHGGVGGVCVGGLVLQVPQPSTSHFFPLLLLFVLPLPAGTPYLPYTFEGLFDDHASLAHILNKKLCVKDC